MSFYEDEDGNKYVVGADSVPKKLGSGDAELLMSQHIAPNSSASITTDKDYSLIILSMSGAFNGASFLNFNYSAPNATVLIDNGDKSQHSGGNSTAVSRLVCLGSVPSGTTITLSNTGSTDLWSYTAYQYIMGIE